MTDFQKNTRDPGVVPLKQVWPGGVDYCLVGCSARAAVGNRSMLKSVPPLAQAETLFQFRVQPLRIMRDLALAAKPLPPASPNVQPRKPALLRQVSHRIAQCLANLPFPKQL